MDFKNLINDYFNLPFKKISGIRCPYFNNARSKKRAELKALIGKGTPDEIVAEAKILSHQYFNDFLEKPNLDAQGIQNFLIENNLGVDCSGLVSHILNTAYPGFYKKIKFKNNNPWRKIITRLRPMENLSVKVYADDKNSHLITDGNSSYDWSEIRPLDMIIMLNIPKFHNRDHILLITEVTSEYIKYIHSREWLSEPRYEGGVTEGIIKITRPDKCLLDQTWLEKGVEGVDNQTWALKAKEAEELKIKRLKD